MRSPFNTVANGCSGLSALSLGGTISVIVREDNDTSEFVLRTLRDNVLPNMNAFPQPRCVLVMDNASVHDHLVVYALCAEFHVLCIFLPPYSYDLNPIELSFH
jgi:hypothetical protein